MNVHHIESRKTGGDSPSNLITLCETCHKEYHKGNIDLKIRRGKSLRDAAVMGIMKWRLYEELKSKYDNISMTFGYSPFEVFGFRLFDRVMFENSYYFIFARRKTGSFNIRDIDGKNQRDITYKKLKLSRCKRFMVQKEMD